MGRFAETTTVEVSKSQGEIVAMVSKRGATDFMCGRANGRHMVVFVYRSFPVKLTCPALDPKKLRTPDAMMQEKRRQWRVMLLWVKAQLEAIDNGLLEPFAVFMPYMQLRDGRTVSEAAKENGVAELLSTTLSLGQPALPAPEDAA